jgi:ferredoxin-thioredoxin reductase catalytic subunit
MLGIEPKYTINPDKERVKAINKAKAAKKEKYGKEYCPCVPPKFHDDDTVCPCREYREHCHCCCGLYIA